MISTRPVRLVPIWVVVGCLGLVATACGSTDPDGVGVGTTTRSTELVQTTEPAIGSADDARTVAEPSIPERVRTGAELLVESGFSIIDGNRVGLIGHQNSVVDGTHLADHLNMAENVHLIALFGPEHGVRGTRDAGEYVEDEVDLSTGVPIYSLFGETREPTASMLDDLDVLLYDLQDVGARYYTYISTMGLAMQAAAEANIEFVVLDRPNPLGGSVAGGVLDPAFASFVGQYPVSDIYGLTAGELAGAITENAWLDGLENLELSVVEMTGWNASMRWHDTGLDWVPPSPALASPDTALLYPALVYFEATSLSFGRGTDRVFELLGAPWLDADKVTDDVEARGIPGLGARAATATPRMLPAMTVEPAFLGMEIPVVEFTITDPAIFSPADAGIHLLDVFNREGERNNVDILDRPDWLDQLYGSQALRLELQQGTAAVDIIARRAAEAMAQSKELESYRLYPVN